MLYYLPLEPYEQRYTGQLLGWMQTGLERNGVEYVTVLGDKPERTDIKTGVVLDAVGRSLWAMSQMGNLLRLLEREETRRDDVIYLEDMFHPGYEALPYLLYQIPHNKRPRIFARNHAQSVDPHDFTFPMRYWMRHYELMVDETADSIFVGSTVHKEQMQAALFATRIFVVGLPFDKDEVRSRVEFPATKTPRVLFTSRWDAEKQPFFFLEMVQKAKRQSRFDGVEFAVSTSATRLRSNAPGAVEAAYEMQAQGVLSVYEGLTKTEYYNLLARSAVQFNCALQDYISYTLCEASALGTASLLPSYLSFPEAINNDERFMYEAWSQDAALDKIEALLRSGEVSAYPAEYNHGTIDRIMRHIYG